MQEYELLIRHLTTCPLTYARKLFNSYAESLLSDEDLEVKAISLETLFELNSDHKIFSQEGVFALTRVNTGEEASEKLKELIDDLEYKLNEIQWRLSESKDLGQYQEEFSNLLETLRLKAYSQDPSNSRSVWLCLRILEEESKRLLIQDRLFEFFPKFAIELIKVN
jgi:hypothetical protein